MNENQELVPVNAGNTAVEKRKPSTVREWIATDEFKKQVGLSLPKHLTPDRFARIALTAFNRCPKLAECTKESVFQCLLDLSAMGLEPDGRRAHLIPFGTTCTLVVDYKGKVELVRRSGEVSDIHADVVYANDDFSYCFGTGSHLKHKPASQDRKDITHVYSYVRLKDGSKSFEVMSKEEIEFVRKKSRGANSIPWRDHWNEMAKKTVFHRHSKWLPLSPELREHLERDDEPMMTERERFDAAKSVTGPRTVIVEDAPEVVVEPQEAK